MIVRIVRMHFTDAGVDEFLEIFKAHRERIASFPGCLQLDLYRDAEDPTCFTTLSHWRGAADLEMYRQSELFSKVWGQVKTLFSERTQAFSLVKFVES